LGGNKDFNARGKGASAGERGEKKKDLEKEGVSNGSSFRSNIVWGKKERKKNHAIMILLTQKEKSDVNSKDKSVQKVGGRKKGEEQKKTKEGIEPIRHWVIFEERETPPPPAEITGGGSAQNQKI